MLNVLEDLFNLARARKQNPVDGSYTNKLLKDKNLSKEKVIEDKGKTDQLAKDMRTSISDVNRIAENLKTTLVSGGSQQQGAWGELLLKNILDSIGFREGEEYHLQKVFKNS